MMQCPRCQHENPKEALFCMKCGTKQQRTCQNCGAEYPEQAAFCMKCGTKLQEETAPTEVAVPKLEDIHAKLQRSMPQSLAGQIQSATGDAEGENRILSILFADVSGSVGITEKMPPEDAADLISECLKTMVDIILKYEGSINRFLGDSVLAFFGIPEAHENDPERAILAALEMREAVTELNLNISIGINSGMVYVGAIGPDSHQEFAAMGTAVNLAARLEKEAQPGQILLGEATYRHTRRAFEFNPLPALTIRGITEPVFAYEVLKQLPRPDKIRGIEGLRAEMIGREKEFADLKERVDELLSGRGQIISVIGEAGVGKSRLVAELKGYIKDKEMRWLEGRCVSIGESISYWVFVDMLRGYLQFSEEDSPEDHRDKILGKMQSLFPQRWEEIVPYLGNLLSVKFEEWDDKTRHISPEQLKHQTFLTLRDVFIALAQQKPLLLILEDLHWADDISLNLLTLLMDTLSLAPLMLLCVYRPEREHRSWRIGTQASSKCLDRYREITLRALNPQESRRLVGALLDIDNLPESIRGSILEKTEGNPFFVEEVIRSLMESGIVYQDGARWVAKRGVEDIAVPDTIQSVIMARIDRLEDEVKYVLQSAAVIGRLFRHKLLQYTTRQERNLDGYLWQLEDRDIVYEERSIPELELAYHYSRSNILEKAVEYLIKAGDKSRKAFANHQAITHYNEAMEKLDGLSDELARELWKGKALEGLGEVYYNLGELSKAVEHLQEAIPFAVKRGETPRRLADIHFWLSDSLFLIYRPDDAIEYAEAGLALLGEDLACPQAALLFHVLGFSYRNKGNRERMDEYFSRNKAMIEAKQLGYFDRIHLVYLGVGIWEIICGRRDSANMWARNCVELCEKNRDDVGVATAYFSLGRYHLDDLREKAECFENSLMACRRVEYGKCLLGSYHGLMEMLCRLGEEEKAEEWLLQGAGLAETRRHLAIAHGYLSQMYLNKGNQEHAKEHLQEALSSCPDTVTADMAAHPEYFPSHMMKIIQYHLSAGVFPEKSFEFARRAVQLYHDAYTFSRLALGCLQGGNAKKAIEWCKEALEVGASSPTALSWILGIMEEAFEVMDNGKEFISYCRKLWEEKGKAFQALKLTQWYLEPKKLSGRFTQADFADDFDGADLKSEWEWIDPRSDASYSLSSEENWLEVRAASGSGLSPPNFGISCLLQPVSGDFAAEAKLKAASDDLPSMGGLLVWKDEENHIRFERGMHGEYEVGLWGNVREQINYFGRGRLVSDIIYLRLERTGHKFSAYCSSNGEDWMTCGEVNFPAEDPIQIGIHAIGNVGIRGGYMDTATRFDCFRVLKQGS